MQALYGSEYCLEIQIVLLFVIQNGLCHHAVKTYTYSSVLNYWGVGISEGG